MYLASGKIYQSFSTAPYFLHSFTATSRCLYICSLILWVHYNGIKAVVTFQACFYGERFQHSAIRLAHPAFCCWNELAKTLNEEDKDREWVVQDRFCLFFILGKGAWELHPLSSSSGPVVSLEMARKAKYQNILYFYEEIVHGEAVYVISIMTPCYVYAVR